MCYSGARTSIYIYIYIYISKKKKKETGIPRLKNRRK